MTLFGFRYPAVIILGCAVAGTLIGRAVSSGLPAFAALLTMAGMVLVYAFLRLPARFYIVPLAVFIMAGAAINAGMKYHIHSGDDIGHYVGCDNKIRFFAEIDNWPVIKRHKTILTCRVDSIIIDGRAGRSTGLIHLIIRQESTAFAFGDEISFTGRLRRPEPGIFPGAFDYARYLYNQGVRGTVTVPTAAQVAINTGQSNPFGKIVSVIRRWILASFQTNLTETPAALASGFLIGETRDIPDPVYRAFRRTGTMHLLAVSGSNVALVLVAAIFILRFIRMCHHVRALILFAIIILFSHLSYNQPSVVRAAIMAALIIGARVVYRRIDLNNIIASAAVILILVDPSSLFDVGFQLSFAVTWGLILFLPYMNELCERFELSKTSRYILLIVFSSFIATLISAPITAYYFGEMSLVTVASNLIVVPLVSAAVLGSLVLLGIDLVFPQVSILAGMFLDRLLQLILTVVVWFDHWEFAEAKVSSLSGAIVFLYLGATVSLFLCVHYRVARMVLAGIIATAGLMFIGGNVLAVMPPLPDVEIFNTGTSHAIIVNHAEGLVIFRQLHDDSYDEFSSEFLPYLARRDNPVPRYYVFLEPRYRTEGHFERAAETEPDMVFRPCAPLRSSGGPTVMTASEGPSPEFPDSVPKIVYGGGILTVQFSDSSRVVYADGLNAYLAAVGNDGGEAEYYFITTDDVSKTVSKIPRWLASKTAVLVPGPPHDQSPSPSPGVYPAVVAENQRLTVPPKTLGRLE